MYQTLLEVQYLPYLQQLLQENKKWNADCQASLFSNTKVWWWFSPSGCMGKLCMCILNHQVMSNSWDPMDYSPPGCSVHGISQTRILEQVAIPFSITIKWIETNSCTEQNDTLYSSFRQGHQRQPQSCSLKMTLFTVDPPYAQMADPQTGSTSSTMPFYIRDLCIHRCECPQGS